MSANNLLSYAGWTFLPNLVTGWIQSIYYGIIIRAGDPKPQPGTPRYQKHRRRIHISVILAYLLYTIYEADHNLWQEGDFYSLLGIPHDVDERSIKSRFRRLAALHHPDKVSTIQSRDVSEAFFVKIKLAQDTLLNPTKRFAYDRFGPDMLNWQHCSSIRDYLLVGLQSVAPAYVGSAILVGLLTVTGYLQWGRYWRYLAFLSLVLLEFSTLTRPSYPRLLTRFLNPVLTAISTHPPLLPFQLLILAHKATITLCIALSQLAPLFQQQFPASVSSPQAVDPQQIIRLEQIAKANEVEASRLLALDMAPYAGDEPGVKELRGRIKEWLVQNTIRADPEVRDAVGRALGKRRVGAPVGAGIR